MIPEKVSIRLLMISKKDRIAGRQFSEKIDTVAEDSGKSSIQLLNFSKKDRCRCRQFSEKIGTTPSPQSRPPTNIHQNLRRTLWAGPVFSGKSPARVRRIFKKDRSMSRQFQKKIGQVADDFKKRSARDPAIVKKDRIRTRQFRKNNGGVPPPLRIFCHPPPLSFIFSQTDPLPPDLQNRGDHPPPVPVPKPLFRMEPPARAGDTPPSVQKRRGEG